MKTSETLIEQSVRPTECPAWPTVVAAPWVGITRPGRTAATLAAASRRSFWASYAIGAAVLYLVILFLTMWDATVELRPSFDPGWSTLERSFAQVWSDWHSDSIIGPAEKLLLLVLVVLPVVISFWAWLFLPTVHRFGRVRESYGRTFRAVTAGSGILNLLVFALDGVRVAIRNQNDIGNFLGFAVEAGSFITVIASGCLLIAWLGRAVQGVAGPAQQLNRPPCCEGCGYDLTHVPASGLCPECGLEVDESITPNRRRPGARWQNDPSTQSWLRTSFAVLVSPGRFYAYLKLRGPDVHARRFATIHYLAIAAGASSSVLLLVVWVGGPGQAIGAASLFCAFFVPLVCWTVHRFVGAVVTSWWVSRNSLPDVGWAKAVIAYETTYLWVPCGYVALWSASIAKYGRWMTQLLVRSPLPGIPVEPVVILLGCTVLCLAWFWRYRSAIRSIRWSNF